MTGIGQIAERVRVVWGLSLLVVLYGIAAMANLLASVSLAHQLTVEVRGAVATANVVSSFGLLVGAFGIPEYLLVRGERLPDSRPTLALLVSLASVGGLATAGVTHLVTGEPMSEIVPVGLLASISIFTSFQQTQVQITRGVRVIAYVRTYHLIVLAAAQIIAVISIAASAGIVYWTWVLVELGTAVILARLQGKLSFNVPRSEMIKYRAAGLHATSQLGNFFSDRGIIFVSSTVGSLSLSAYLSVGLSAMSLISIPVAAYTPRILSGSLPTINFRGRRVSGGLTLLGVCCLIFVCAVVIFPTAIPRAFGPHYELLGKQGAPIACVGLMAAVWRVSHLALRRMRRPGVAVMSDAVSLSLFTLALASGSTSSPAALLAIYFGVGFFTSSVGIFYTSSRAGSHAIKSGERQWWQGSVRK